MNEVKEKLREYAKCNPELINRLNAAGVDAAFDRWSAEIEHRKDAEKLARDIGELDFLFFGDSFYLKYGGDGDNGETLTYILDVLFDLRDAETKGIPFITP